MNQLTDIKLLSRDALLNWLAENNMRSFRADQILKWLYVHLADSFDQMTNLRKEVRATLEQHFTIQRLAIDQMLTAKDGTRKYLFKLHDGETIESVLIPERNHFTLCVSSQVGCAQGCKFCLTGESGLVRNLTSAEIVGQVWEIRKQLPDPSQLTNLVFMGMGEPLANYPNLVQAIEALTNAEWGMSFANRRVTISTAGIVPRILDLGRDTNINIAISLNAVDDDMRTQLMPINRKYPIADLIEALRQFPLQSNRKITIEYILFKDLNDSEAHARKLTKILAPIKAKINLIPFNPFPGSIYQRPSEARIKAFQNQLIQKRYTSMVRYSKGLDIMAACGQLRAGLNQK